MTRTEVLEAYWSAIAYVAGVMADELRAAGVSKWKVERAVDRLVTDAQAREHYAAMQRT